MATSLRRRRCAASRRRRGASSRTASDRTSGYESGTLLQVVDQVLEGIESQDTLRVGHEVRERVDVVEVMPAVAIVAEVLDAADVAFRRAREALHLRDEVVRRRRALHPESRAWRVDGAGAANEVHATRGLAGIGGAEVERSRRGIDVDGVEVLPAERL